MCERVEENYDCLNKFTGRRGRLANWMVREIVHLLQRHHKGENFSSASLCDSMTMKPAGQHKGTGFGSSGNQSIEINWETEALVLDVILAILDSDGVREDAREYTKDKRSRKTQKTS